ncbi:hypothetical protein [Chitinophaga ginsengisoli]|uniref:Uncharacterized protein n=1 Tax=Chitinophaga ginsengisoli TaxID=363837 RepID=A0A2P8GE65_9BACT|nr:hypothetical protein [Chitinophaga ginsengisoli]PSL32273.1 hypothetical protein CLV42_104576 [Chitinophaga ginsengisoli]
MANYQFAIALLLCRKKEMQFDGAVITEQRVTFAIVVVKSYVLSNNRERESTRRTFGAIFSGIPIILMVQNSRGMPTYHGRDDIVNFLSNIHPSRIPWKRYNY